MPRIGHKEGCQCRVCLAMAKKTPVAPVAPVASAPAGPTFGSLPVGSLFEYPARKTGTQVYRKCSLGTLAAPGTATNTTSPAPGGSPAVPFEENALVIPR